MSRFKTAVAGAANSAASQTLIECICNIANVILSKVNLILVITRFTYVH